MKTFSSSLLRGRLVFGKYPKQEEAKIIEENNYTHVINMTCPEEITWEPVKWSKNIKCVNYPFKDGKSQTPVEGWDSFESIIQKCIKILSNKENKLYLFCLGGHNRSCTLAAILYARIKDVDGETAISRVYRAHQQRTEMKDKWRKLGAPQRQKNKDIIKKYAKPA